MHLPHWTKQSPPHSQLPILSPSLCPHLGPWPPTVPTTEMSLQCCTLQEAMETHSRQLAEEVRGLWEQLGRLPHPRSPFSQRITAAVQTEEVDLGWFFSRRLQSKLSYCFPH